MIDTNSEELAYFFADPARFPVPTAQEERTLIAAAQAGNSQARDEFLSRNMLLVVNIACKFGNQGIEMADLIQVGSLGLMKALDKFDAGAGTRFSTYATYWVRQAISRYIDEHHLIVRVKSELIWRQKSEMTG